MATYGTFDDFPGVVTTGSTVSGSYTYKQDDADDENWVDVFAYLASQVNNDSSYPHLRQMFVKHGRLGEMELIDALEKLHGMDAIGFYHSSSGELHIEITETFMPTE